MDELALDFLQSSKKKKEDDSKDESLCDTVDFADPSMIEWLTEKGLNAALQ